MIIVIDILSRIVLELSQFTVQISDTLCFCAKLGGLETTYDVHLGLIGKRKNRPKIGDFAATRHFDLKFQVEGVAPTNY